MNANTRKSENLNRILVLIVLNVNLVISFIQIGILLGITVPILECSIEIWRQIFGRLIMKNIEIYACIESFVLIATIISINKKKSFMIPCTIVVIFLEVVSYLCLTIFIFYRNSVIALWQILADQSPENENSQDVTGYAYLIVFFTMSIYFVFKYYSIMVLYAYKVDVKKESIKSAHGRGDVECVPGLRTINGYLDAPPPYDFYAVESAMSGFGNGII